MPRDNIVEFHGRSAKPRTQSFVDQADEEKPRRRNERTMHTFAFRSLAVILESDEHDLVRDVCFDMHKAKTKLKKIRQRSKSLQEQTAEQMQQLSAAETKLAAAIVAAQNAPVAEEAGKPATVTIMPTAKAPTSRTTDRPVNSTTSRDLAAAINQLDPNARQFMEGYIQGLVDAKKCK